jgi:hypothetical protein
MSIKASTARSMPSRIVSRYLSVPARVHPLVCSELVPQIGVVAGEHALYP